MSKSYSHEQLLSALFGIQDLLERARVPFFLVRGTLVRVMNSMELDGDHIDVGVKKSELTENAKDVMKNVQSIYSLGESSIEYIIENISVIIHIYPDDVLELQNPDTIIYAYEPFLVPNPIKTFLQKSL